MMSHTSPPPRSLSAEAVDSPTTRRRYADRLRLGKMMHPVANSALRLVSAMKRDWIQTGRSPAGVCGAALYLAARMHGEAVTKHQVMAVVHVGGDTIIKRLDEMAAMSGAALTPEEFLQHSELAEQEAAALLEAPPEEVRPAQRGAFPCSISCPDPTHPLPLFSSRRCLISSPGAVSTSSPGKPTTPAACAGRATGRTSPSLGAIAWEGRTQSPLWHREGEEACW